MFTVLFAQAFPTGADKRPDSRELTRALEYQRRKNGADRLIAHTPSDGDVHHRKRGIHPTNNHLVVRFNHGSLPPSLTVRQPKSLFS